MKKVLFVPLIIISISIVYSQPRFTLQLSGGYSLPLLEFKGGLPTDSVSLLNYGLKQDVDYNTYHMKNGFNFGLTGKYAFGKKGNIRLTLGGGYKMFFNSEEITSNGSSTKLEPKINIINIAIGAEYAIVSKSKFTPYFGIDLAANIINGKEKWTVIQSSGSSFDSTWTLASATRFGFGAGAGFDFAFSKSIGINFGLKYNMMNIIGKDADTSIAQWTSVEQPLNDKEYTKNGNTYSSRNIADLQVYAGVSFFFGQPKKIKK